MCLTDADTLQCCHNNGVLLSKMWNSVKKKKMKLSNVFLLVSSQPFMFEQKSLIHCKKKTLNFTSDEVFLRNTVIRLSACVIQNTYLHLDP